MEASRIGDGLWRWVVPHPDWKPEFDRPDGWGRMVACVYAEYDEAVVLIDPLVPNEPEDAARFWRNLDDDVLRLARPMLILVGCVDHGRSADLVAGRYASMGQPVQVVGDAMIRDKVSCVLQATFDDVVLPAGLQSEAIAGMSPGERAFVLAPWRAAVFSDAVIGTGLGRVRVAPPSWGVKTEEGRGLYDREFRASIRRIATTRPEVLLPSHGNPVLVDGAAALDEALRSPALGE
jgi:hypothetical protein